MLPKSEPLTESYFYILLCMYHNPLHGYGIMQESLKLSGGRVKIGSGTMYGAVSNMLKKDWIREVISAGTDEKNKRKYELTELGKEVLDSEIERLRELLASADQVIDTASDITEEQS